MKCYKDLFKTKKIKTMNTKMTTNSQLSKTEPKNVNKNKLSKQLDWNRIIDMEIIWRVISWEVEGGEWGKRYGE